MRLLSLTLTGLLIARFLVGVKIKLTVATARLEDVSGHQGVTVGFCEKQVNKKIESFYRPFSR